MANEFGKLIHKKRKSQNKTLKMVATACGIPYQRVYDMEKGYRKPPKNNPEVLVNLSNYLEIDLQLLLELSGLGTGNIKTQEKYAEYFEAMKNRGHARVVATQMEALKELLGEISREASGLSGLEKLAKKARESAETIDAALRAA